MKFSRVLVLLLPAFLIGLLTSPKAEALVELRGHYTYQAANPNRVTAPLGTFNEIDGFGGDIIVSPPLFPLHFGLRYEDMKQRSRNNNGLFEVSLQRWSALGGFRFIDTLIYLGGLATIGLEHGGEVVVDLNSTTGVDSRSSNDLSSSYTLGLEGGVKLAGWILGAEAGHAFMKIKGKNGYGEVDLSGAYFKLHVGVGF